MYSFNRCLPQHGLCVLRVKRKTASWGGGGAERERERTKRGWKAEGQDEGSQSRSLIPKRPTMDGQDVRSLPRPVRRLHCVRATNCVSNPRGNDSWKTQRTVRSGWRPDSWVWFVGRLLPSRQALCCPLCLLPLTLSHLVMYVTVVSVSQKIKMKYIGLVGGGAEWEWDLRLKGQTLVKSVISLLHFQLKYLNMIVFREPFSIEIDPLQCDSLYCALFFFKTAHHPKLFSDILLFVIQSSPFSLCWINFFPFYCFHCCF